MLGNYHFTNAIGYPCADTSQGGGKVCCVLIEIIPVQALADLFQFVLEVATQFAGDAIGRQVANLTSVILKLSNGFLQPLLQGPFHLARPFKVVIENGLLASQPLRCIRSIGKENIGNILGDDYQAVITGNVKGFQLFCQRCIVTLKPGKILDGSLANVLLKRDDGFAQEFGESLGRPGKHFNRRTLVAQ